jgi:Lon protease-like protein
LREWDGRGKAKAGSDFGISARTDLPRMEKPTRIPLFPLDVVLLPSMPLPLHIFEPRYKEMIGRCLEERLEFGLALASNNGVVSTGCTAEIVQKIRYPDGRLDILTEGRSPFHLAEMLSEQAYYEGIVEYLTDEPSRIEAKEESTLVERFGQCHLLLFGQAWEQPGEGDDFALSYRMAGRLPMELEKKQALLEMRAETERQTFLLQWLEDLLPKLAQRQRGRRVAGGNGHALN